MRGDRINPPARTYLVKQGEIKDWGAVRFNGKARGVLNLDGSINEIKTNAALEKGRIIRSKTLDSIDRQSSSF
jgi:hypothetical protein